MKLIIPQVQPELCAPVTVKGAVKKALQCRLEALQNIHKQWGGFELEIERVKNELSLL